MELAIIQIKAVDSTLFIAHSHLRFEKALHCELITGQNSFSDL